LRHGGRKFRHQPASIVLYAGCLLLLAALPTGFGWAQSPRRASIIEADRFIDRIVDGEPVSYLIGNVYIDRDTLTARADTGLIYRDRELYDLRGNVRLRQLETLLTCRRAFYRGLEKEADFFGDVRIVDGLTIGTARRGESRRGGQLLRLFDEALMITPEYSVWADSIERDRVTEFGEAFGHVKIVETEAAVLVTGGHATFSTAGQMAEVDRDPVLTSRDRGGQLLTAVSRLMRFYQFEDRAVLIDSVHIVRGRTEAVADTAYIYSDDRVVMRGSPRVWMGDGSIMIGDEIEFHYRDNELREVYLRGQARMEDTAPDSLAALYAGLPKLDVIEGDSITVYFEDKQIKQSVVIGRGRSIYVPMDTESELSFNDVQGDTIIIDFKRRRVSRVSVIGNTTGIYRFANFRAMTAGADSLAAAATDSLAAGADSLAAAATDSLAVGADSLATAAATDSAVVLTETPTYRYDFDAYAEEVLYSGHSVEFDLTDRTINITGESRLVYDVMTLTAEEVRLDTDDRELYARGNPLIEEGERLAGEMMGYNFDAKTGSSRFGVTAYDGSFYVGEEIYRFPDGTVKIHKGKMTTCDLAAPHYHIWADKMKMKMGDKVVAKPVVIKVGEVPVFALPFYFKSLKSGRRSGITFPNFEFGWSERDGRFIRDLGYYWATNDYTDFLVQVDWNESREVAWRIINQYHKRYTFSGNFGYNQRIDLQNDSKEWQLRWSHNQPTLFDDYRFKADVKMASQTLTRNDLSESTGRDVVSGQLRSSAYISRNFSFASASLNLSRDERVNASDDDPTTNNQINTMILPSLTVGFKQRTVLPAQTGGRRGSIAGELLRNMYYQHSYGLNQTRSERENDKTKSLRANGSWRLELRPPRMGIFNWSAGANAAQVYERVDTEGEMYVVEHDTVETWVPFATRTEDTNPSFSLTSGLGTTLYGVFGLNLGRLQALRHTLRLNVGYSFRPNLSDKQRKSQAFSLSVGNRLDLKYLGTGEDDSTLTEKKLDGLIDWQLSTAYNPDGPTRGRWSTISSSLNFRPAKNRNLNVKVSNTIDPYNWAVLSTRIAYGFQIRGKLDTGRRGEESEPERNAAIERLGEDALRPIRADSLTALREARELDAEFGNDYNDPFDQQYSTFYDGAFTGLDEGGEQRRDPTEDGRYLPFRFGASFSYSRNSVSDISNASGNFTFSANVTRTWEFSYRASFDLVAGQINRQEYSLHRDLHCWKLEFTRIISNIDQQFGFRLYLRGMPDLKLSRGREDLLGTATSGIGGALF